MFYMLDWYRGHCQSAVDIYDLYHQKTNKQSLGLLLFVILDAIFFLKKIIVTISSPSAKPFRVIIIEKIFLFYPSGLVSIIFWFIQLNTLNK
jgi:hypothetical protein